MKRNFLSFLRERSWRTVFVVFGLCWLLSGVVAFGLGYANIFRAILFQTEGFLLYRLMITSIVSMYLGLVFGIPILLAVSFEFGKQMPSYLKWVLGVTTILVFPLWFFLGAYIYVLVITGNQENFFESVLSIQNKVGIDYMVIWGWFIGFMEFMLGGFIGNGIRYMMDEESWDFSAP